MSELLLSCSADAPKYLHPVNALVTSDGHVYHVPPFKAATSCETSEDDKTPSCKLVFGSWVYNTNELKLSSKTERADVSFYIQNNQFELFTTSAEIRERMYACCPNTKYGDISYTINMKRRRSKKDQMPKPDSGAPINTVSLLGLLAGIFLTKAVL